MINPELLVFPVWIKGIRKAVTLVNLITVNVVHFAQHRQADFMRKHQRTSDSTRDQRAVDRPGVGWPSPHDITGGTIRHRDPPHVRTIVRIPVLQADAEVAMGISRNDRIMEVIQIRWVAVLLVPEIHPRM